MTSRKKWNEPVQDLGEWDTSVTDDGPDEVEAAPPQLLSTETPVPAATPTPSPRTRAETPSRAERRRHRAQSAAAPEPPAAEPVEDEPTVKIDEPAPVEAPAEVAVAERPTLPSETTAIGASIVIRGRLTTAENLAVFGRIDAEIRSTGAVRVERSGVINANMSVHTASIDGILVGNVRATDLVELLPNARVVGDLVTPRLIVHEGALLRGRVEMDGLQALEILEQSPVQAPTAQPRDPAEPRPRAAVGAQAVADASERPPIVRKATAKVTVPVDPPRAIRADVVDWDEPEIVSPSDLRAPAVRVPVEPFAARVPVDPSAVKADYRSPRSPDAPPPSRLEPAAPPPRPRPAATPSAKPADAKPADPNDKGSWFRGR